MNINLISPSSIVNQTENGHSFTVRFKEDVLIPENSKIYLNYASLSRDSEVEFYEDQTVRVKVVSDNVRPSNIPQGDFNENLLFAVDTSISGRDDTFIIPKGVYSYQLFQTKLTAGLNNILTKASNIANLGYYRAVEIIDLKRTSENDDADFDLAFGVIRKNVIFDSFTLHDKHLKNCDQDPDADGIPTVAYRKTTANAIKNDGSIKSTTVSSANNVLTSIELTTAGSSDKVAGVYPSLTTTALSGTGTGLLIQTTIVALDSGACEAPQPFGNGSVAGITLVDGGANDHTINTTITEIPLVGGNGAEISLTIDGNGQATTAVLTKRGNGYISNQLCGLGKNIGGTQDVSIRIATVLTNGIRFLKDANSSAITRACGGKGYAIGDTFKINGMGGTDDSIYTVRQLALGSNAMYFDNYAFSAKTIWTGAIDDQTPLKNCAIIKMKSLKTYNQMVAEGNGSIICGINSQEVASGLYGKLSTTDLSSDGDSNTRISGNGDNTPDRKFLNPVNMPISNQIDPRVDISTIANYINLQLDFRFGLQSVILSVANNQNKFSSNHSYRQPAQNIRNQESINFPINSMNKRVINLAQIMDGKRDSQMEFGIQFYKKNDSDIDEDEQFFRILNLNTEYDENLSVSKNKDMLGVFPNGIDKFCPFSAKEIVWYFKDTIFKATDEDLLDYLEGGVSEFDVLNIGTDGKTNGVYPNQSQESSTGRGTGIKLNYTVAAGVVVENTIVISDCGNGYKVNDTIFLKAHGGNADTTLTIKQNDGIAPLADVAGGDGVVGRPNEGSTRRNKYNSQNPFNICLSALTQNDGWSEVSASSYTKVDNKPITYFHKYELEGSDEISKEINIPSLRDIQNLPIDPDRALYPNSVDTVNDNILHLTQFSLNWRNESYSIYIEELPISNYKNTEFIRSGGHSKNILCNIPAPFQNGAITATNNNQRITSIFQPSFKVISNLYNQELSTNHFKIDIRKQRNDKPATEIKNSIINFTIEPPDGFKGKMGAIGSLL